jgi:4-amino-4-deoxy-L-arabinose transferase-like glycosyltransferase
MLAAGSWFTPLLNGVPYLDKPHLLYWLNLLSYKIFGVSDWAARVPTLGITLGEVWVTYLLGRRLVGREAAWLGGFVLLSCIGFFSLHLQILTDHLITLTLAASLYFLLRWQEAPAFKWAAPFFLCLVAGFLSKGFIGVVFPVLIGLLYAWLGQPRLLGSFSPGLAWRSCSWPPGSWSGAGFLKFSWSEQILRFLGQRQPDIMNFPSPGMALSGPLAAALDLLLLGLYRFGVGPGAGAPGRLLIWPAVVWSFSRCPPAASSIIPGRTPALILGGMRHYQPGPACPSPAGGVLGLALLLLLPGDAVRGNRRIQRHV